MQQETITYSREKLYEEIWKEPMRTVAVRYGISDVALGKICRKLGVPMPGVGYWARIAAGRKLKQPPLKPLAEGQPSELTTQRWVDGPAEVEAKAIRAEEENRTTPIVVAPVLADPHALVAVTRRLLGSRRGDRTVHPLDISVSPAQLDRSLRIMDALLKALEGRGYRVEIVEVRPPEHWKHPFGVTRALVDGVWVPFALSERIDLVPKPDEEITAKEREHQKYWGTTPDKPVPSGCLTLRMEHHGYDGTRAAWRDGKRQRVEDSLGAFLTAMRVRASVLRREDAERQERERQRAVEQARREEAERLAREEKALEARLRDHVARWRFAQDAREYVAHVRRIVSDAGVSITARGPLDESLLWIEGFADRTDPLTPVRKEAARVAALNRGGK